MNGATVILFGLAWFIFSYIWYGNVIKKKVLNSSDNNITPSNEINDGIDFVPTNPQILFGHHFSSIAGAGPIVGPIFAFALFGWLPAMIWILVGSVFMGAVHDYTALIISVRNKGVSILEISDKVISKKARIIFTAFVWLTLVLVQAVFADLTARTLAEKPEIVIPTIGLIAIAMIFGWSTFRRKMNLILSTALSLILLFVLILLGNEFPIALPFDFWLILSIIYAIVAGTLPVWFLLQPRDYLSMYILIIGLLIGFVGVIVLQPEINGPAFIEFNSKSGPLFPILFITIACGAISGFHSLVSSGTSSKQLNKESDGKKVAYGGMLAEGALALLVIVMISSVLVWKSDISDPGPGIYFFQDLLKQSPNIVFGTALGITAENIGIPLEIGIQFGVLMLNAFILTTLDTSARLNRYIVEESLGKKYGGIFKNRYFAISASLIFAYLLCISDGWSVLWPMFGTSNQLIAALGLFVISAYLFGIKSPKWYTLVPGIIMLLVTEAALVYQIIWIYVPGGAWHLAVISAILFILGITVSFESSKKLNLFNKKIA